MHETELKFTLTAPVTPEMIEALRWSPYALGPRAALEQRDTFFDSADFALSRAGHAVRLREGLDRPLVTLKGPGEARDGLHRREEIELATASGAPQGWPAAIRARLERIVAADALAAIFVIETRRVIWPLLRDARTLGEIALDHSRVLASAPPLELHELEIELKGGTLADLQALRATVLAQLPAQPEDRSKFARGLAALRPDLVRQRDASA
ncbi:inorganic triphosphatase [Kallotenue papyrolyticum]|uniref:CYTH domain-containing protein n=1 Tax=Kallotenue papyrolyticum TaxID=1325125 RepID=UPI0004785271|nr:CYTH domain-containing protein [Kallotenue papyrolyticum]